MAESLAWKTAAPLWDLALEDGGTSPDRFHRPELLRFESDSFMDDFERSLGSGSAGVAGLAVRSETWRDERAGWVDVETATSEDGMKLFLPAHSRFYLLSASLVCKRAGLPDRVVDPKRDEVAAFVMRRLVPRASVGTADPGVSDHWDELAWIGDRQRGRWARVLDKEAHVEGEEELPLFASSFDEDGRTRRVWSGFVPVGSREVYESGARASFGQAGAGATSTDPGGDPRIAEFGSVMGGLAVIDTFEVSSDAAVAADDDARLRQLLAEKAIEFGGFLEKHAEYVWAASGTSGLGAGVDLYDLLDEDSFNSKSWLELLKEVAEKSADVDPTKTNDQRAIELLGGVARTTADMQAAVGRLRRMGSVEFELIEALRDALPDVRVAELGRLYEDWNKRFVDVGSDADAQQVLLVVLLELVDFMRRELPNTAAHLFDGAVLPLAAAEVALLSAFDADGSSWAELLVDAESHRTRIWSGDIGAGLRVVDSGFTVEDATELVSQLDTASIEAALLANPLPAIDFNPSEPTSAEAPALTYYVARFVYRRPKCAAFEPTLISKPSRAFRLASFFDPDAPVRPIEIRLPEETDVSNLASFPKNVSILVSKQLRKQMDRAQSATIQNWVDGSVPKGGSFDLGMLCTLSIPIITICALILLMIVVAILNMVFFWLPFFRICLPLPKSS